MYVENRTKIANFHTTRVFSAPADVVPLGILYRRRGLRKLERRSFRWSKKFSYRFSSFDTIPECDSHPASQPASHVAVAITLNAKASSLQTVV